MKKEFTLETYKQMIEDVVAWNSVAGNSVDDKSLIPLYQNLSVEEWYGNSEFMQSWFKGDDIGVMDGLCDEVFTAGFLIELTGQLLKHWIPHSPEYYSGRGVEWNINEVSGCLIQNPHLTGIALFGLLCVMSDKYDIQGAFNEVKESNYSKFPLLKDVDIDFELDYITKHSRYGDITHKLVGEGDETRVVFLAGKDVENGVTFDKGKIVKPSTFFEPRDLGRFVY